MTDKEKEEIKKGVKADFDLFCKNNNVTFNQDEDKEFSGYTEVIKTYTYDIFGYKYYTMLTSTDVDYVEMYIDMINNKKPDKMIVVEKYLKDNNIPSNSQGPSVARILAVLNNVELDLKSILDSIERESKIDSLLD